MSRLKDLVLDKSIAVEKPGKTTNKFKNPVSLKDTTYGFKLNRLEFKDLGDTGTDTFTLNASQTNAWKATATGNFTVTFDNLEEGETYVLLITQDPTGSRTMTVSNTVLDDGTITDTLTTAVASAIDLVIYMYDGSNLIVTNALKNLS